MNSTNVDEAALRPEVELGELLSSRQALLEQVWQAMRNCLCEGGLESELNLIPHPQQAQYKLIKDPYDQSQVLAGEWRNQRGDLQGEIKVRDSGQVYAEADVIRNHPTDSRWFVEAVTAWGSSTSLKTELRLIPSV